MAEPLRRCVSLATQASPRSQARGTPAPRRASSRYAIRGWPRPRCCWRVGFYALSLMQHQPGVFPLLSFAMGCCPIVNVNHDASHNAFLRAHGPESLVGRLVTRCWASIRTIGARGTWITTTFTPTSNATIWTPKENGFPPDAVPALAAA